MDWSALDWWTIGATFVSVLIGAGITLYLARQATRDLKQEAESLRWQVDALMDYLAETGAITPRRDPATGRPLRPVRAKLETYWDVEASTTPKDHPDI